MLDRLGRGHLGRDGRGAAAGRVPASGRDSAEAATGDRGASSGVRPLPLAQARPLLDVEGREPVRLVQEQVSLDRQLQLVVVRNGQLVLADSAMRFSAAVEYVDDVVGRFAPSARTPGVLARREELSDLYDLTLDEIDEAIRFELIARDDYAA